MVVAYQGDPARVRRSVARVLTAGPIARSEGFVLKLTDTFYSVALAR